MRKLLQMRVAIAIVFAALFLALPRPLLSQDVEENRAYSDDEIKKVIKLLDTDANGTVELSEHVDALDLYYSACARAGKSAQAGVEAANKGLPRLQWFLSADLDDNHVLSGPELEAVPRWLLEQRIPASLSESDIDLLVNDFELRIRRGVKLYWEDESLRGKAAAARKKEDRLKNMSQPYRDFLVDAVLRLRVELAVDARQDRSDVEAFYESSWNVRLKVTTADGDTYIRKWGLEVKGETVIEWTHDILHPCKDPVPIKDMHQPKSLPGYKFVVCETTGNLSTEAGTFTCKTVTCSLAAHKGSASIHPKYSHLRVQTVFEGRGTTESVELIALERWK